MTELYIDDIFERMKYLDEDVDAVFDESGRFQIIIVGGGALILRGYLSRATEDIDIISADMQLYDLMSAYDMNGHVNAYINNFPYNYEDRTELVWSGSRIDYYTASLEDIVIAKLCSNRPDDISDIELVADMINWELLQKLALDENEIKASSLNELRYLDFLGAYKDFERRFRPCKD